MNMLDAMNEILTPDAVMWAAACVSLALLVLVRPVTAILTGGRRDSAARVMRIVLALVLILVVALPFLVLVTGEAVAGLPCGCFLLLFPLFCYYFGKGIGVASGRKAIMDFVGLDDFDGMEDAQDRLYESRLRFPGREGVVASIASLTRAKDAEPEQGGKRPDRNSEILDVMVEEI